MCPGSQDRELRAYFHELQWYKPDPKCTDVRLNKIEARNVRFILDYQKRHGLMW